MSCPRCGVALGRTSTEDVWRCAKCTGMVCGVGELARALVAIAPELVPDGGVGNVTMLGRRSVQHLACPTCGEDMEPVYLGGVEVDRCLVDDLVWFDRGEYELVVDIARDQHVQRVESWPRRLYRHWFGT